MTKNGNIWSRPNSKEFRDNYDGIFRKPSVVGGDLADEAAPFMAARIAKEIDEAVVARPDFDGYADKFAGLRGKMRDEVAINKLHDDLRDHAEWLWCKFMDRLEKLEGQKTVNFLGSAESYKRLFMAGVENVSD